MASEHGAQEADPTGRKQETGLTFIFGTKVGPLLVPCPLRDSAFSSLKPASPGDGVQTLPRHSTSHTHPGLRWEGSTLTPEAKMAGFPLSSMSSSSSLVVVRPAASRGQTEPGPSPEWSAAVWPRPAPAPPLQLTDLQLPLDAALAALAVVRLRGVVLGHHLHELPGQRGVLGARDGGIGVRPSPSGPQSLRRPATRPEDPSHTCVLRILRSAEERFRPSSCSMLCSMPGE